MLHTYGERRGRVSSSYMKMAAATDTFRLSVPNRMGMVTRSLAICSISGSIPSASFPITRMQRAIVSDKLIERGGIGGQGRHHRAELPRFLESTQVDRGAC